MNRFCGLAAGGAPPGSETGAPVEQQANPFPGARLLSRPYRSNTNIGHSVGPNHPTHHIVDVITQADRENDALMGIATRNPDVPVLHIKESERLLTECLPTTRTTATAHWHRERGRGCRL